ncbi:MAG: hypothetical protein OEW08_11270 [Gammaproteobacteria bacterium]|nr:hypothetical protein [Gammaproteobacteria bacterium]
MRASSKYLFIIEHKRALLGGILLAIFLAMSTGYAMRDKAIDVAKILRYSDTVINNRHAHIFIVSTNSHFHLPISR